MTLTNGLQAPVEKKEDDLEQRNGDYYLQKFWLYETRSKFYMIGLDKSGKVWRVLKIDRLDPSVLTIDEDPTIYTQAGRRDLLKMLEAQNMSTGGLQLRTICYGIIGFAKFLEPYYIYIITKRTEIGAIGAHKIYSIAKCEMIPLQYSKVKMAFSKVEDRHKRLLCKVDITKDFFFSYSYPVMCSLQTNIFEGLTGPVLYEKMFVWNEFLTRGIRHQLMNTAWTVALVHGYFKQVKLSIDGRDFNLVLIARRSRHYAGTRFLKRGVNKNGRVANDVDTEQILFEDAPEGCPMQISSVVQNRGSIPLFWSQDFSRPSFKPDIILSEIDEIDKRYEATKLHFENLVERYGNPIIVLNLIKNSERKPRESVLRSEFANAIEFVNRDLLQRLQFVHWDLQECYRSKKDVLVELGKLSTNAMRLTGFFYCRVTSELSLETGPDQRKLDTTERQKIESPMFQFGVLRTNCIDSLDRTNVAQYTYGLAAIGHQLHALGFIQVPKFDLKTPIADSLMLLYEEMGDAIALQYGGSPAHNKIFAHHRGESKAAIRYQELLRGFQRFYSNAFMDAEKQDSINMFLGYFQPQQGKPALCELDSHQHCDVGTSDDNVKVVTKKLSLKRSFSDGNINGESIAPVLETSVSQKKPSNMNRFSHLKSRSELFVDVQSGQIYLDEDTSNVESIPEVEVHKRPVFRTDVNGDNIKDQTTTEAEESYKRYQSSNIKNEFSDSFAYWISFGEALCKPYPRML